MTKHEVSWLVTGADGLRHIRKISEDARKEMKGNDPYSRGYRNALKDIEQDIAIILKGGKKEP